MRPAVGHADEPHVFDRPVAQHLLDMPLAADRQIHPVRAAEDVVELQAGLADRRVIHDLEEAGRVRHQGAIEERLVRLEQIHQVNKPLEVGGLVLELQQDTSELSLDRLGHIGNQPDQPQRLPLGLGKAGGFVEPGVVQDVDAAFARASIGSRHWFLLFRRCPVQICVPTFVTGPRAARDAAIAGAAGGHSRSPPGGPRRSGRRSSRRDR